MSQLGGTEPLLAPREHEVAARMRADEHAAPEVEADDIRWEWRENRPAVDPQDAVDALVPELGLPPIRRRVTGGGHERDRLARRDVAVDPVARERQHPPPRHWRPPVNPEDIAGPPDAEDRHDGGDTRKRQARHTPDQDDSAGEQNSRAQAEND